MDENHSETGVETETETFETSLKSHGVVTPLWTNRKTVCDLLGISKSTFYRRLKSGAIESRRIDGRTRYRVVSDVRPAMRRSHETGGTETETETETSETKSQSGGDESGTNLTVLLELVGRLTDRVTKLERERAEALVIGHRLADERDQVARDAAGLRVELIRASEALATANESTRRLQSTLQAVLEEVTEVAQSVVAIPVRRRLRAILAT